MRLRLRIHGRVQGVFFRYHARERAHSLGLSGWVRNRPDGSVEAVVEGPRDAVERFVAWAHQGPPSAEVDRVEADPEPVEGEIGAFRIAG